jgi:GMP synthase (glutamine-hydrolysing)
MTRVLFIQNGEYDHAGLFEKVMNELGITLEVIHAWRGDPVPAVPNGWAGVVLGGGAMSAYEQEEFRFLHAEEILIRAARKAHRPVFGFCLGAQLMASAMGGSVFPNRAKEIGLQEVRFLPEAERDPLWHGQTAPLRPVHWHRDTFTLPPDAVRLAFSDLTENQLFRADDLHYGMQFHLEIDEPSLAEMVEIDDESLLSNGVDPEAFLREASTFLPRAEPVARAIFTRWAGLLG